jgi:hypothetical protein
MSLKDCAIIFCLVFLFNVEAQSVDTIGDAEFEQKVENFIMNHPEIIISSLEKYKNNREEIVKNKINEYIKQNLESIEDTNTNPYFGNINSDLTIVMFFDYYCSYCRKANEVINQLLVTEKNIKIIYKPYPVLSDKSSYLSKISLAVYSRYPNKFKQFHDECMSSNALSEDSIKIVLQRLDIDLSKIELEMTTKKVENMQLNNIKLGTNLYITAVPTFIINGTIYSGMLRINQFMNIIEESKKSKKIN